MTYFKFSSFDHFFAFCLNIPCSFLWGHKSCMDSYSKLAKCCLKYFKIEYSMSNQRTSTIHVHFQFNEISKRRYYTHTNQTFTNKSCLWAQWTFSVLYFGIRLVIWEMPSHVFLHYCCMAQHTTATEHIPDKKLIAKLHQFLQLLLL